MTQNLVSLNVFDPSLVIDARYSGTNNFLEKVLYPKNELFLLESTAERLKEAQEILKQKGLGLKVWDAYRPHHVQKLLWEPVKDERYVADPEKGSRHNRGCAVDITLVNSQGRELAMPTPFDEFTERAHRNFQNLSVEAIQNRQVLEDVMVEAGFIPLPTEWWHFDDPNWKKYEILDINPWEWLNNIRYV